MHTEFTEAVELDADQEKARLGLFRFKWADLWASALFGIAQAGAMALLLFAFALALRDLLAHPAEVRQWLLMCLNVICIFPLALIWLGTFGGVVLFLFAKAAPEPRTPGGWIALCAFGGGVVFYASTLPFWARIESPREPWPACLLLMGGTALCQAGGAWGANRRLRRVDRPGEAAAKSIRFTTANLLWVTLDVSLIVFLLQLMGTRYEKFLPLTAIWFAFQIASLAMGAAVLFAWRETLRLHLYGQLPRSDRATPAVPRGTQATPAD